MENQQENYLNAKKVAQLFNKSQAWAYKHWNELGGKKFGGSIIYPPKEKIIEIVFSKKQLSQT